MTAGVRIKYPSNWNTLENLGNVSGNNIVADFYLTGTSIQVMASVEDIQGEDDNNGKENTLFVTFFMFF
jgi:hypothetical protein